jgi:hypothetical protein
MHPLRGFALAPPEEPPLHHLERGGLEVDQDAQQPIIGGRQRTVLVGCVPPGGARLPVKGPVGHMGLERGPKGRDQVAKLVQSQTGQSQELRGAGLDIGTPSRAHGDGLLSSEAQDIINRDELYEVSGACIAVSHSITEPLAVNVRISSCGAWPEGDSRVAVPIPLDVAARQSRAGDSSSGVLKSRITETFSPP